MKGRIDQLRCDYRQQEKVKKEIVDQLKFSEQKNEADYERYAENLTNTQLYHIIRVVVYHYP